MPLPKASLSHWPYAGTGVAGLGSPQNYARTFQPQRITALKELIATHHPPAVVFYGARRTWPKLLDVRPQESHAHFDAVTTGMTHLLITDHPGKHGEMGYSRDARFDAIGEYLRTRTKRGATM